MAPEAAASGITHVASHGAQCYGEGDQLLVRNVCRYLGEGLRRGDGCVVIATAEHADAFTRRLAEDGVDSAGPVAEGRLVLLDAERTLAQIVVGLRPAWERFDRVVGAVVRAAQARSGRPTVRAYGDMVGLLWRAGRTVEAVVLEEHWNRLLGATGCSLFCGYPVDVLGSGFHVAALDGVLCTHTHLLPSSESLEGALDQAMVEVLGPGVDGLRHLIRATHRPSWAELPRAEATVLWLRRNLPDYAERILERVRRHHNSAHLTLHSAS